MKRIVLKIFKYLAACEMTFQAEKRFVLFSHFFISPVTCIYSDCSNTHRLAFILTDHLKYDMWFVAILSVLCELFYLIRYEESKIALKIRFFI